MPSVFWSWVVALIPLWALLGFALFTTLAPFWRFYVARRRADKLTPPAEDRLKYQGWGIAFDLLVEVLIIVALWLLLCNVDYSCNAVATSWGWPFGLLIGAVAVYTIGFGVARVRQKTFASLHVCCGVSHESFCEESRNAPACFGTPGLSHSSLFHSIAFILLGVIVAFVLGFTVALIDNPSDTALQTGIVVLGCIGFFGYAIASIILACCACYAPSGAPTELVAEYMPYDIGALILSALLAIAVGISLILYETLTTYTYIGIVSPIIVALALIIIAFWCICVDERRMREQVSIAQQPEAKARLMY